MITDQRTIELAEIVSDRIVTLHAIGHSLPATSDQAKEALADAITLEYAFYHLMKHQCGTC